MASVSIVILKWQYHSALAGMYSILADETKDCSKKEQLSLVVRYADVNSATIFEHLFIIY